jgi:hypothetical protein
MAIHFVKRNATLNDLKLLLRAEWQTQSVILIWTTKYVDSVTTVMN